MDLLSLVLWVLGAILVLILVGAAFLTVRKQREHARCNQAAQDFGVTIPSSVVVTSTKGAHPTGRVEYRLPHYASGSGESAASAIVIPVISTLIIKQWMFSSVYPTHISDLAWQLRGRGYDIPLSPEEAAKAA